MSKIYHAECNNRYRCIVVDPPWDQGKTGKRSVRPNQTTRLDYATMTPDEIKETPITQWADENAYLWIWATNSRSKSCDKPILVCAFELMAFWGFRYYTAITWDKRTGPCPFGPYQITTETVLFGYRGKACFPKNSMGKMKTIFTSPVTRHSEKPKVFYDYIAQYFEGPRLDVFARRPHEGFEGWGIEYEKG